MGCENFYETQSATENSGDILFKSHIFFKLQ